MTYKSLDIYKHDKRFHYSVNIPKNKGVVTSLMFRIDVPKSVSFKYNKKLLNLNLNNEAINFIDYIDYIQIYNDDNIVVLDKFNKNIIFVYNNFNKYITINIILNNLYKEGGLSVFDNTGYIISPNGKKVYGLSTKFAGFKVDIKLNNKYIKVDKHIETKTNGEKGISPLLSMDSLNEISKYTNYKEYINLKCSCNTLNKLLVNTHLLNITCEMSYHDNSHRLV